MNNTRSPNSAAVGLLAAAAGKAFRLEVCRSAAGYYLGTCDATGVPFSRESVQYWRTAGEARTALTAGEWTQRLAP